MTGVASPSAHNVFLYFAYGSNMLKERLCDERRCPRAVKLGTAFLPNYTLQFSKRSVDNSGKATIARSNGSVVHGVVYQVPFEELAQLDKAAGAGNGYDRLNSIAVVEAATSAVWIARTYIAHPIDASLQPYDWYLALVIAGAVQNELPREYIDEIRRTGSIPDPDQNREARKNALRILEVAKPT